jgi:predicted dehydrogenase
MGAPHVLANPPKVALIGGGFIGPVHAEALRRIGIELTGLLDITPERARPLAQRIGISKVYNSLDELLSDPTVGAVHIASPNHVHYEHAKRALEAGKHVLCEKPLANTLAEAREMLTAARNAGTVNMVCFNYRRAPAVQLARKLVEEGRLGEIRHWRATYLQDFIMDPSFPLIWRLQKEVSGSGALGDIGAHIIDLAHFVVGPISEVTGMTKTFVEERPLEEDSAGGGLSASGGTQMGEVTVDDAAAFLARFENGAIGTFEATRFAAGRRNQNAFEVNGSKGSVAFDLERMNELEVFFTEDEPDVQGFRTVNVTEPDHPYTGAWWPPGHILGYEHTFVHTMKDLMDGIKAGKSPAPTFEDGYRCQAVLDAVERSAASGEWRRPEMEGI